MAYRKVSFITKLFQIAYEFFNYQSALELAMDAKVSIKTKTKTKTMPVQIFFRYISFQTFCTKNFQQYSPALHTLLIFLSRGPLVVEVKKQNGI